MDKLTMAHEMALKIAESGVSVDICAGLGWRYADAMQAEADKRKGGVPEAILKASNSRGLEWQPDWSQAPDEHVKYFAVDENMEGGWHVTKPDLCGDHWYWSDFEERREEYSDISSFNYQGDWRNSLRERSETEMEAERNG